MLSTMLLNNFFFITERCTLFHYNCRVRVAELIPDLKRDSPLRKVPVGPMDLEIALLQLVECLNLLNVREFERRGAFNT